MKNSHDFKNYAELLKYFKATHKYILFSEYQKKLTNHPIILLRHDVDYSLKLALEMAKLEADLGIKSTYFILFSSDFYTLFDEENIQIPLQIKALGHEIGLHYDVAVLEKGNKQNPLSLLNAQAAILGELAQCQIRSIAMHHPASSGADLFRDTQYINAYDDHFTKKMTYFSDSGMAWRNEFVNCVESNNFPPQIQLLIHPIWWFGKGETRWEKLDEFIQSQTKNYQNLGKAFTNRLKKHSGVIEHDARIKMQKK
jgi:hypothetical protein